MIQENFTRTAEQGGLISYLAKLGLGDAELARIMSLLQPTRGGDGPMVAMPEQHEQRFLEGEPPQKAYGDPQFRESAEPRRSSPVKKTIKLFLAEEQQILKEAYQSFFSGQSAFEMLGSSDDTSVESLVGAVTRFKPDVMVLGVKRVQSSTVETLEMLREASPQLALVLLFAFYDGQGLKALREFSTGAASGCAYLLKHTIDTMEQLTQVIHSVVAGRIIVDPMVMEGLIKSGDAHATFLGELSPKELEVLSWMAKGYRNETIADVLSRDVKTVERHINNIYSKLHNDKLEDVDGSQHPRVRAALAYLRATGLLPSEQNMEL